MDQTPLTLTAFGTNKHCDFISFETSMQETTFLKLSRKVKKEGTGETDGFCNLICKHRTTMSH